MVKEFEVTSEQVRRGTTEVSVFHLKGYLDAHTAPAFERAIEASLETGPAHVVVDCERLEYISSAGLGILIDVYRTVQPRAGSLRVSSMSAPIAEIFDILGFSKVIPVYPTLAVALEDYGENTA